MGRLFNSFFRRTQNSWETMRPILIVCLFFLSFVDIKIKVNGSREIENVDQDAEALDATEMAKSICISTSTKQVKLRKRARARERITNISLKISIIQIIQSTQDGPREETKEFHGFTITYHVLQNRVGTTVGKCPLDGAPDPTITTQVDEEGVGQAQ